MHGESVGLVYRFVYSFLSGLMPNVVSRKLTLDVDCSEVNLMVLWQKFR